MSARLLAALLLLAPVSAATQSPAVAAPPEWNAFAKSFVAYADSDRIVGASVVLMRNGVVIARQHVGMQDRARNIANGDSTIHHWGSITKTLTAVAIMQLRDRGKLSLDDKVVRFIPERRRVHDPFGMIDSITIRMLLSHSSGFRNGTWPYAEGRSWQPFEPTEWGQLVAMMPYQQLLFKPGTRYGYSNPAFVYLARIVEGLTGDPWNAYVAKNIFAPLGMTRSYFRATPRCGGPWQAGSRSLMYLNPANGMAVIAVFNTTNYANPASALYDRVHRAAQALLW